jgi:hypothetical protein
MKSYQVLSIDAWADVEPCSWTWNQWFNAGKIELNIDAPATDILSAMCEAGFIRNPELGDVEDDGHNVVIVDKETHEPIFAIVYGEN